MAATKDRKLLAVARENNSIEIWLRDSWVQLLVIPGNKNCAIRNIHWLEPEGNNDPLNRLSSLGTCDQSNPLYMANGSARRLITTGLNGVVIEWDLRTH